MSENGDYSDGRFSVRGVVGGRTFPLHGGTVAFRMDRDNQTHSRCKRGQKDLIVILRIDQILKKINLIH